MELIAYCFLLYIPQIKICTICATKKFNDNKNQFPPRASSYKISYLYLYQNLYNYYVHHIFFSLSPFKTWPAASARRSSPSSPWRRTGGAPLSRPWTWPAASAREELLLAEMAWGARRDKEAGREGAERCSQRGSRRREGGAAPARSSVTGGAVRRGDEIWQPDGVGVVVGVVLGKNGEMGTTVPRRGYIYPAHWSRLVALTGTKG